MKPGSPAVVPQREAPRANSIKERIVSISQPKVASSLTVKPKVYKGVVLEPSAKNSAVRFRMVETKIQTPSVIKVSKAASMASREVAAREAARKKSAKINKAKAAKSPSAVAVSAKVPSGGSRQEFKKARAAVVAKSGDGVQTLATPRTVSVKDISLSLLPSLPDREPDVEKFGKWGDKYWQDPRIHSFGNSGVSGAFHAAYAPFFAELIDQTQYDGVTVRDMVLSKIPDKQTIIDFACGTGQSTAPGQTGLDSSPEMLGIAKFIAERDPAIYPSSTTIDKTKNTYVLGNAESYGETDSYDVVTMFFATHEMPKSGRWRVIRNALRVARKTVIIVDIDTDDFEIEKKSDAFLSGEPYIFDYIEGMNKDVQSNKPPGWSLVTKALVPKRVKMWRFDSVESFGAR
jgi:SAM-dependent methyltransferase